MFISVDDTLFGGVSIPPTGFAHNLNSKKPSYVQEIAKVRSKN